MKNLLDTTFARYNRLGIQGWGLGYKENFEAVISAENLESQEKLFENSKSALNKLTYGKLDEYHRLLFEQLDYEVKLNLERIGLEKKWLAAGGTIPKLGLHALGKEWYVHYLKKWITTDYTPEFLYEFGLKEIKRCNEAIAALNSKPENLSLVVFTNKERIAKRYDSIEAVVKKNMSPFFDTTILKPIEPMSWPDATYNTPPGMYLNKNDNSYGVSVFQYSFYNDQHKEMNMDWLFMHEAIPGHHYQACFRETLKKQHPFQSLFYYAGNAEGWAAYIEYLGKDLGLYRTPQAEYGHLQWDLVRSTRICIDIGIHYKGWSRDEALKFWKENIKGQDDIAEREVDRCTRWPAQAISYKAGAYWIMQQKQKFKGTPKEFHKKFLSFSYCPLAIINMN